jgi:hypothetical protein
MYQASQRDSFHERDHVEQPMRSQLNLSESEKGSCDATLMTPRPLRIQHQSASGVKL